MEILVDRCCGIEASEKSAKCCVLRRMSNRSVERLNRTFGTFAPDLVELADWLRVLQVTHIGMPMKGLWWRPVRNALEQEFTVVLSEENLVARSRNGALEECEWIAELLLHGLLTGITVSRSDREADDLRNLRSRLLADRNSVAHWIKILLVELNIRLASITSDLLGRSGQAIITAILEGGYEPEELAELAKGRLRTKIPQLRLMLPANITEHERFLLRELLDLWRDLGKRIAAVDKQMHQRMGTARKRSWRATGAGSI